MSQNVVPASSDGSGRSAVAAETRQATTEQRPEMRQAAADVRQQEPAASEVSQAVSEINDYLQSVNRELRFRVDEALPLGRAVISIIDSDTQETIREIPSKEALALAQRLQEERLSETANVGGLFISDQA
ncbi:MAG TPA: flagellar protein FlaG [Gammaproteobacteria bacterium]